MSKPGLVEPIKSRLVVKESSFVLPTDKNVPVIMIGPGAGIAPFRAFLEEKEYFVNVLKDN